MGKDPNSPDVTSQARDVMGPRWSKITTLLGGTETMRLAGEAFLPRHPAESDSAWRERLSTCTLLNMVDMTLTSLVSRPFASPIKVEEDVPEEIVDLTEDVDLQGNSLDRFARNWFRDGLAKGWSAVLVEFPRPRQPEGRERTHEDDLNEELRPYFVSIASENVLGGKVSVVNGKEVLEELRIREEVILPDGKYGERIVERVRVLTPGFGEVFEKRKDKQNRVKWVKIESYTYDLTYIPVVFFYSDRQGFMLSKPPLTDLADLNIRHWQSTSDQITILTVSRFPMLAVSGAVDTDALVVGPHHLLSVTDATGRFYYVEHTGKAIAAGRQDILDLEEVMAEYGATFLKKRPGGATATARALDSAEVTSALQDMALGFQDALNEAMEIVADWMSISSPGKFKVKTDFTLSDKAEAGLEALKEARKLGDLSRTQYLRGLVEYGVLPEDFPFEENKSQISSEDPPLVPAAAPVAEGGA